MTTVPRAWDTAAVDDYLGARARLLLEQRYYEPINRAAATDALASREVIDEAGVTALMAPDRGVVAVCSLAQRALWTLDIVRGRLIADRSNERMEFMRTYGVLLSYMSQIRGGAPIARHLTDSAFDDVLEALLAGASSRAIARVREVTRSDADSAEQLRALLTLADAGVTGPDSDLPQLESSTPEARELSEDIVDTLRVVRCAPALHMRSAPLRTSGGYELFVDRTTADAVCALETAGGRIFLVSSRDPHTAGRANLAVCELTRDGNVRFAPHTAQFLSTLASNRGARAFALIALDAYELIRSSFGSNQSHDAPAPRLQLERGVLETEFFEFVRAAIELRDPSLAESIEDVPALGDVPPRERIRYDAAERLALDDDARGEILVHIGSARDPASELAGEAAFRHVRRVRVQPDEVLVDAGDPSGFVYVAEGDGLAGNPVGEYPPFVVKPWTLIGARGAISGAPRSARIVASREVSVLMIPPETYLQSWYRATPAIDLARLSDPG